MRDNACGGARSNGNHADGRSELIVDPVRKFAQQETYFVGDFGGENLVVGSAEELGTTCPAWPAEQTAILVQRTVGGNLGEILDTVAETMRERIRIRGEIQTLTAQQKLTGLVIGALPLGVGVLFQFMSPEYISPLFHTLVGKGMLGVALVLETVGLLIIQRILNIEV